MKAKTPKLHLPKRPHTVRRQPADPLAPFIGSMNFPPERGDTPEQPPSIVTEPVQLQCWWRGDVPAREPVSCHLSGSPMWPGVIAGDANGDVIGNVWIPGYERARLPDPVLLGCWVDGPPDALWDLWVTIALGEKRYVDTVAACLPAEFHERTRPTWATSQVLTVTLRQQRQDAQPTRFGIGLEFLAFRSLT